MAYERTISLSAQRIGITLVQVTGKCFPVGHWLASAHNSNTPRTYDRRWVGGGGCVRAIVTHRGPTTGGGVRAIVTHRGRHSTQIDLYGNVLRQHTHMPATLTQIRTLHTGNAGKRVPIV